MTKSSRFVFENRPATGSAIVSMLYNDFGNGRESWSLVVESGTFAAPLTRAELVRLLGWLDHGNGCYWNNDAEQVQATIDRLPD